VVRKEIREDVLGGIECCEVVGKEVVDGQVTKVLVWVATAGGAAKNALAALGDRFLKDNINRALIIQYNLTSRHHLLAIVTIYPVVHEFRS
jgi:hypothetical protein